MSQVRQMVKYLVVLRPNPRETDKEVMKYVRVEQCYFSNTCKINQQYSLKECSCSLVGTEKIVV